MSLNNKRSRNNKNTKKIKGGKCGGVWPFQDSTCYLKHDSDVVVKQDANCKKVKDADGNEIWQVKIPVKGWNETDSATSTFTAETLEDADKEKILKNECDKLSSSEPTEETVEEPSEPIATETVAPTDTVESNIQPSAPAPFAPMSNEPSSSQFGTPVQYNAPQYGTQPAYGGPAYRPNPFGVGGKEKSKKGKSKKDLKMKKGGRRSYKNKK